LHLDWSKDSSSLVSVSQAYELKFARVDKSAGNKADISATALKDEQWATWTCKFGFPVQGIWQGVDYTDINTVCASPSRQLLVTGGDDQIIRLFKYPAVVPKQKNKAYIGHASHVTRVRFSHD
jgi:WD40 repeat protein